MTVSISKDIEVDYVKASDIKLRFRLRPPNQERVDELAESIEKIGLLSPPTIDNENFLVCGFHRKLALEKLGFKEIPVIRKDYSLEYAELGEIDEGKDELSSLSKAISEAKMPKLAKDKCLSELKKLKSMSPMSAEATVVRNYLDWMTDLPWSVKSKINTDLVNAQKILDEDHYGLEKVKERIIEFLAVQKRMEKIKGPILCLVGPPGVGKTSLGKSIAKATNREFVRMSVGGMRDEAEIRGHRRTYIGSLPGKIIQMMKKAGTKNPLILLDEIDKIGNDYRGDPSSALLEALDPEQNTCLLYTSPSPRD
mgnify:CR=1 FL=1